MNRRTRQNAKLNHAMNLLAEAAQEKRAELVENIENRYEGLRHVLGEVSGTVKERTETLRRQAESAIHQGQKRVERNLTHTFMRIERSVHHHPWKFLGGVALVSFIYGYRAAHRRSKKEKQKTEPRTQESVAV